MVDLAAVELAVDAASVQAMESVDAAPVRRRFELSVDLFSVNAHPLKPCTSLFSALDEALFGTCTQSVSTVSNRFSILSTM